MYGWYAYDPRMRSNIGIRRRLAPLLDNSRAELELAHALLFSLPGSPFLYYGDEIGMGDNIWLPDRDARARRCSGRPTATPGSRPPTPASSSCRSCSRSSTTTSLVNVESQLAQSRSLLHWVRNVIHVRKAHPVFGLGDRSGAADRPRVRARVRARHTRARGTHSAIQPERCCASSRSRTTRCRSRSTAPELAGRALTDLFGGGEFPTFDDEGTVTLTLGTQSFYWLHIAEPADPPAAS